MFATVMRNRTTALGEFLAPSHRVEDVFVGALVDKGFEKTILFEQGSRTIEFDEATSIENHLRDVIRLGDQRELI
jgi:hypothetical protein